MDDLGSLAWSVDQNTLERDVAQKANEAACQREIELETKRLVKTRNRIKEVSAQIAALKDRIANPSTRISQREKLRDNFHELQSNTLKTLLNDEKDITDRLKQIHNRAELAQSEEDGKSGRRSEESEREFLIRTGKITPFDQNNTSDSKVEEKRSHRDLARPAAQLEQETKRRRKEALKDDYFEEAEREKQHTESDEDSLYESVSSDQTHTEEDANEPQNDDGNMVYYHQRLDKWSKMRSSLRTDSCSEEPEWKMPHPKYGERVIDKELDFRIPGDVWVNLFEYQKTGVRWLWELYRQKVGGIIGDEMGLGKTIQVAAFLAGLHYSGMLKMPVLIVCPATVMHQWVAELHQWWPPLRVAILHSIGSGVNVKRRAKNSYLSDSESENGETWFSKMSPKSLVSSVFSEGHVLITTYAGLNNYRELLLPNQWEYCCLDEGHKIRNPNSTMAITCKQVKTVNRLILSGTPIQNNLTELWSLFDFIYPGRLGTLPVFQAQFATTISIGGYANATNIQVQTAYKCAVILRDLIAPYMLRRMKSDVANDLPHKTEKVLFCRLTRQQKEIYLAFLKSSDLKLILEGKRQVLYGIDILRKICNHPDLLGTDKNLDKADYGDPSKSGKMQVVKALLELWAKQDSRTLLFAQTRQMLNILEKFIRSAGYAYLRMDGSTPISMRQQLVDSFNDDKKYKVFLLTTKVGGLGVNLTGANRVIIYDPDWNPSTDMQARERAWRLGQRNEVVIYRLMIAGSIEEKIYHRQIFKQFLTNKILEDPKQKRFFKNTDLHDLFTLGSVNKTEELFSDAKNKFPEKKSLADAVNINGVASSVDLKEKEQPTGDEGILASLFAKAGVQSAMEHDAIIESSRPDTLMMEKEARRIATEAAETLKQSWRLARQRKLGSVTWTGRFGTAGKLAKDRSSSAILQTLRKKRDLKSKEACSAKHGDFGVQDQAAILASMYQHLVNQPSHCASSRDIIKSCGLELKTDEDVSNLRQLLRQIADWKSSHWELKEEYFRKD